MRIIGCRELLLTGFPPPLPSMQVDRLSLDAEWVGEYFTNSNNTAHNDSYILFNGRWMFDGLSRDGWSIQPFVSANNMFNVRYYTSVAINVFGGRYFEPGSSRNLL